MDPYTLGIHYNPAATVDCVGNPVPNQLGPYGDISCCGGDAPPQPWSCYNGNCYQEFQGQYQTEGECIHFCNRTWKCKNKGRHPKFGKHCVQVPYGGDFATKEECQSSKGCAQLRDTVISKV